MINKPTAQSVINLTGTTMSECTVGDIIDDAALMAGSCLDQLSHETQAAALKWLAAHMITCTSDSSSQIIASQSLGDASESYARGSLGEGINSSYYGQQAMALAPCLSKVGKVTASIEVI